MRDEGYRLDVDACLVCVRCGFLRRDCSEGACAEREEEWEEAHFEGGGGWRDGA